MALSVWRVDRCNDVWISDERLTARIVIRVAKGRIAKANFKILPGWILRNRENVPRRSVVTGGRATPGR